MKTWVLSSASRATSARYLTTSSSSAKVRVSLNTSASDSYRLWNNLVFDFMPVIDLVKLFIFFETHTHTRLTALFLGLPGWAGTRKVKPIWILLEQETVSGSGISWAVCKSAPRSRQITMSAPHYSQVFLQAGCPSCRPTNSVKALKALSVTSWSYIETAKCFSRFLARVFFTCCMQLVPTVVRLSARFRLTRRFARVHLR